MARRKGTSYRLREGGVRYDSFFNRWTVGEHQFEFPQLADIFVYCWKNFGPSVAIKVKDTLKEKLDTTISSFVKKSVGSEALGQVQDFLAGAAGVAVSAPVALVQKLIDVAVVVLGDAYLKGTIEQNKAIKYYAGTYSPAHDLDLYCDYVLYSWFIDPVNGPYYATITPGRPGGPKPL